MEWVAIIVALHNEWGPTRTFEELRNPANIDELLKMLDTQSLISVMSEPEVIDWLTQHHTKFITSLVFEGFETMYFPNNIGQLLEKMKAQDPAMYNQLLQAGRGESEVIRPTFQAQFNSQYLGFPYDADMVDYSRMAASGDYFHNPFIMRRGIESKKLMSNDAMCNVLSNGRMPYLSEVMTTFINNRTPQDVCNLFQNCFLVKFNLHQLFGFLRDYPIRQSIQSCKRDTINSFGPTVAQIYFANPSAWCDSDIPASQDWTLFLPQWRCVFLFPNNKQCQRFNNNSEFCVEHSSAETTKRLKRVFVSQNDMEAGPIMYNAAPNNINQPLRYESTGRAVTSMRSVKSKITQQTKPGYYLPIVRYSGLYYSAMDPEPEKKYCGKFFFYEPETEHCMYIGSNSAIFATKVHAYIHLAKMSSGLKVKSIDTSDARSPPAIFQANIVFDEMRFIQNVPNGKRLALALLGNFQEMILNTVCTRGIINHPQLLTEYLDTFLQYRFCYLFNSESELINEFHNIGFPLFFPTVKSSELDDGYGVGQLDFLDQPICKMARSLNIGLVVLQHEIGSHDCVTEVLHTSNFESDIADFPRVETSMAPRKHRLPKIWFPADNGIIEVNPSGIANLIMGNLSMFHTIGSQPHLQSWSIRLDAKCLEQIDDTVNSPKIRRVLRHQLAFDEPGSDTEEGFKYF
jgi:hypothetical protein